MRTSAVFVVVVAVLASGCGSGVSTSYDFDPDYDFDGLRTYAWMPVKVSVEVGELRAKRLGRAFDDELARLGMKANADDPDFLINLHGSSQQKTDITDWGYGYGPYWGGGGIDVTTYQEGTIIMDFVDAESRELFWRGVATAVAEPNASPEQQEARFAQVARQLLAPFPPKK